MTESATPDPARILKSDGSQAIGSATNRPSSHPQRVIATDTVTGVQRETVQGADARAEGPTTTPICCVCFQPLAKHCDYDERGYDHSPTCQKYHHEFKAARLVRASVGVGERTINDPQAGARPALTPPVAAPGAEDATPEPPHVREDYREVRLSDWRAGKADASAPAAGSAPETINLNDHVWVKLRPRGKAMLREQDERWSRLYARTFGYLPTAEKQEADYGGWSQWQLWSLIECFGPALGLGSDPPFETTLRLQAPVDPAQETREASWYCDACNVWNSDSILCDFCGRLEREKQEE